jgi:hypothetical protein
MSDLALLNRIKTGLILFLFFFTISSINADSSQNIIINEIAWAGTEASYNDEWIELYNNTGQAINLEGWTLMAEGGSPEIVLTGKIPGFGFYLLERTDDTTVPDILADQIYTGALSNNGEHLKLFNNQNNLIDQVNCLNGWFGGDNSTKQTMERKNPLLMPDQNNWQTSEESEGTPKSQNSKSTKVKSPESGSPETSLENKDEVINGQNISYPSGIIFNEILPSPEGPDAENEWVEIFNKNSFEVNLSGWKISDVMGSVKAYIFPEGVKIQGLEFLILSRVETKITLNNDEDSLILSQPNDKIIDEVSYKKAPQGKSYALTESGWDWNNSPSPGKINTVETPETSGDEKELNEEIKNGNNEFSLLKKENQGLADVSSLINKESSKSLNVFLTALIFAIISGIIFLFLKKTLK